MEENRLVMISCNIPRQAYDRIKHEKLRYNDLIMSALHYKDMDIRENSVLKERIEKMAVLLDRTNHKVWEMEGKILELQKNKEE